MLSVSKWARENRTYPRSAAIPGPRDPHLTPYIVPIEDAAGERLSKRIVVVTAAQSGKSEGLLDIAGQRLDQHPVPILYVGPNKQFLTEQFEPRVMALLDEAPTLAGKVARGKRMTKTRKMIAGVPLRLAHAGSSAALKSDPAALALVDEYDEMLKNIKGQGDPLGLVERRGDTYADFVCVVTSTCSRGMVRTVHDQKSGLIFWRIAQSDEVESPIWKLWQAGTRHHWSWPCPHCGEYFVPRFDLVRYPKDATPLEAQAQTFIECPRCGGIIEEHHKADMNERGKFVAPGQYVEPDGTVVGDPPPSPTLSYWVSGLASPFVTFGDRVKNYVEAVEIGDDAMIQTAVNAGFGECYSPGGGEVPEWEELKAKSARSSYARGEVPDGVRYLTLTADVQKQSIPYTIRGWGAKATSWLVDYGRLHGDTAEEEVWDALGDLISTPIDGVPIRLAFVDSGFRPGKSDTLPLNRVYEFCRRFLRRVRPTKGSSTPMRTPMMVSKIEVTRAGKASKFGLDLIRLDTDHWKSWVHERARWDENKAGSWHLPKNIDDDYCHQIVSEARLVDPLGKPEWVQRSKENHFLDCEAMQAAAGYMLNVQRIKPSEDTEDQAPVVAVPAEPAPGDVPVQSARPVARPTRRVVRSNYMG